MLSSRDLHALQGLADRFAHQDAALLDAVLASVLQDPEITKPATLAHHEFRDHLPEVIEALARRLRQAAGGTDPARTSPAEWLSGERHAVERWMQGYSLTEVIIEWRHLASGVIREISGYAHEHPRLSREALIAAFQQLSDLVADGIRASAEQFVYMQRVGSASMAAELQASLEQLRELERERAETWRRAVHDLRGSVGAVSNAAELLRLSEAAAGPHEPSREVLARGLTSLRDMLNDLATLARLDATQEPLQLSKFDVSDLLRKLAETVRPSASMRGLVVEAEGPDVLEVAGDALKVQRIAQNLLLNGIKYTERGGVWMSWQADANAPAARWILTVRDTGPGLDERLAASVVAALLENPASRARDEPGASRYGVEPATPRTRESGAASPSELRRSTAGEGIGLSIVKVLCRLLGAAVALDNVIGRGVTFRVTFPSRYPRVQDS
jgi:signal transduction histidine kinase